MAEIFYPARQILCKFLNFQIHLMLPEIGVFTGVTFSPQAVNPLWIDCGIDFALAFARFSGSLRWNGSLQTALAMTLPFSGMLLQFDLTTHQSPFYRNTVLGAGLTWGWKL